MILIIIKRCDVKTQFLCRFANLTTEPEKYHKRAFFLTEVYDNRKYHRFIKAF